MVPCTPIECIGSILKVEYVVNEQRNRSKQQKMCAREINSAVRFGCCRSYFSGVKRAVADHSGRAA
jgi:hypothetical protein